jgi:transcriptional regulator with XRE-family HTH domain
MSTKKFPTRCLESKPTKQTFYFGGQPVNITRVAEETGLNIGHCSRVLRGKTNPSISTAMALSKALGMHLEPFLDLIEEERVA